jgi:hypothetical protein
MIAAAFVAACSPSSSTPTPAQGEAALRAEVQKETAGKIAVVSFAKTDGQKAEVFGTPAYWLSYTATLRTGEDVPLGGGPMYAFTASPFAGNVVVPKGTEYTIAGIVGFLQKESGWVLLELKANRLPNTTIDALRPPAPKRW